MRYRREPGNRVRTGLNLKGRLGRPRRRHFRNFDTAPEDERVPPEVGSPDRSVVARSSPRVRGHPGFPEYPRHRSSGR